MSYFLSNNNDMNKKEKKKTKKIDLQFIKKKMIYISIDVIKLYVLQYYYFFIQNYLFVYLTIYYNLHM